MANGWKMEFLPTVSVIIPARNSAATLGECLRSIREQTYPAQLFETLFVDNQSTDETPQIARALGFEPLLCARRGPAAARNAGLRAAKGEIIAFIDSDAAAQPDWLSQLVQPFANPKIGGVGGKIIPKRVETGPEIHASLTGLLDQEILLRGRPPFMLPFAATANAAFRAAILREIGGFDEALFIGEDADLAWRAQWAGWRMEYAPLAIVRHRNRSAPKPYFRQIFQYGEGGVKLFAKHRARLGRRIWIDWRHWGWMLGSLPRFPVALFKARAAWQRKMPIYDLIAGICYEAGRIRESLRSRVIAI